ncbi:hypothetical protein GQ464_001975 [Rhodocaloribacter litoris]|uniref:hypothetical protein n=1 Tax=Rhodocaloribacter litoris TaxID=2558931 RepID=UPI0014232586|nr:hypothetical protein [Rhodocaloribacter litoris]QXD15737.1 hypothetical protein GQ464_001975 [Rhodocaloribacter litoris]GIV60237.1 MAG: hypothetical protein KatS3mg043_1326 [Rhodothermaceae bacterium]
MTRPNLILHIDELVLDGFPETDRALLAAAVEAGLARLLAERGLPPAWPAGGAAAHHDGGAFEAQPNAGTARLGLQLASAIYGGLTR